MKASFFVVGLMVVLLICNFQASECTSPFPLVPKSCLDTFEKRKPPPPPCCIEFKRQLPFICLQIKTDLKLREYIYSSNGTIVVEKCYIPFPVCKT
ncbi:hypothetical protein AAC387_Pa05g3148 [Persea americana]